MSVDAPAGSAPAGTRTVPRLLGSIDDAGEAVFDRLRERAWADGAAAIVSNLSDYGYVWVAFALWKARRRGPGRRRAVLALASAGATSYTVNKMAKRLVGRHRPDGATGTGGTAGTGRIAVRRPTSSSFPSGHTLAAFCTALVLTEGTLQTAGALAFAGAVAASRVHLRAHHASDVLAGAAIGTTAGLVVRRLLDRRVRQE